MDYFFGHLDIMSLQAVKSFFQDIIQLRTQAED